MRMRKRIMCEPEEQGWEVGATSLENNTHRGT